MVMKSSAPTLLLVDDDASSLRVLSRMLSAYPDQRLATSGEQALQLAQGCQPDLMLIDMQMPGMSGVQLCAQLKGDPQLARVPVLFVTSDDTEETRLEALQLGAAGYLTKPVQAEQLQARVAAMLRDCALLEEAKTAAAASGDDSPPPLHSGPSRLLVVDDDAGALELLRHTLRGIGEVRAVQNGETALALLDSWQPDLVLVDARMQGMDGFELCRRVRADHRLRHVPVMFVTRLADVHYEAQALEVGAAEFITKPYSPAILKARVRNLLELKHRTDLELAAAASQGQRLTADRLRAVIDGASDAIITVNASGQVALMNAAAGRLLGLDHRTAPGLAATELLGARLPDVDLTAPSMARRAVLVRAGQDPLPTEVSISMVGDDALRLTTLMIRDLSDRERLQAESQARAAAEAANRTKALMMSYVAHEIGNPLNCILGFAQLLAHDSVNLLTPVQAHRLKMIEAGCTQLSSLMQDLRDLGHFELGRLSVNCEPLDAVVTTLSALQTTSALAQQADVVLRHTIEADTDTQTLADENRLRQCLINLISNAVKYNKPDGHVDITLRNRAGLLEIAVVDTGMGMDDEQIAQLYEPFNRLGRQASGIVGSGLGLYVTRQLIEAMGGQLTVTSQAGVGSRFTILLRLAAGDAVQASAA